jgi:hypothetical protein
MQLYFILHYYTNKLIYLELLSRPEFYYRHKNVLIQFLQKFEYSFSHLLRTCVLRLLFCFSVLLSPKQILSQDDRLVV